MYKQDIRLATFLDDALMLKWGSSADCLIWKKNSKKSISKTEHEEYFHTRLADKDTEIFMILNDGTPSVPVRSEKKADFVYTDIYVLADACRAGLASFAINESIKRYARLFGRKKFCVVVHPKNNISENFFKNGFYEEKDKPWP